MHACKAGQFLTTKPRAGSVQGVSPVLPNEPEPSFESYYMFVYSSPKLRVAPPWPSRKVCGNGSTTSVHSDIRDAIFGVPQEGGVLCSARVWTYPYRLRSW